MKALHALKLSKARVWHRLNANLSVKPKQKRSIFQRSRAAAIGVVWESPLFPSCASSRPKDELPLSPSVQSLSKYGLIYHTLTLFSSILPPSHPFLSCAIAWLAEGLFCKLNSGFAFASWNSIKRTRESWIMPAHFGPCLPQFVTKASNLISNQISDLISNNFSISSHCWHVELSV